MKDENVSADDFIDKLNPDSVRIQNGLSNPSLAINPPAIAASSCASVISVLTLIQLAEKRVFNRTVGLKDSYKPAQS